MSYIAFDFDTEMKAAIESSDKEKTYALQDGNIDFEHFLQLEVDNTTKRITATRSTSRSTSRLRWLCLRSSGSTSRSSTTSRKPPRRITFPSDASQTINAINPSIRITFNPNSSQTIIAINPTSAALLGCCSVGLQICRSSVGLLVCWLAGWLVC